MVQDTFNIDKNTTIKDGAVFYFKKGAKVVVRSNATLTLDSVVFDASARPISSKSCMWEGIVLESGGSGTRLVSTNSTIRFAKLGVKSRAGGAKYRLTTTHLLDNLVGLEVQKHDLGIHDGQYRGCVFEVDSLDISGETSYGIRVFDNSSIRFGNRGCGFLGSGEDVSYPYPLYSKFIDLDYGIWGRRTSATVVWNEFYNCQISGIRIIGHEPAELLTDSVEQWEIGEDLNDYENISNLDSAICYSVNFKRTACFNAEYRYSNYFEACEKAIYSSASTRILVQDNAFESNGYAALVELSKKSSNWQCYSNCVRNGEKGFVGLENINMKIDFKDKDLERLFSLNVANFTTDPAMQFTQAAPAPVNSKNTMVVENNRIWNYGTGIWISGRRNPLVLNNRVDIPRHSPTRTYGIRMENVEGDTVSFNFLNGMAPLAASGTAAYVMGIELSNSPNSHVVLDTFRNVDQGIRAVGPCNHSNVWKNDFDNYKLAFYLGASSLIGDQRRVIGSTNLPHDNTFGTLAGNIAVDGEGYLWSESALISSSPDPMEWYTRLPVPSNTFPAPIAQFSKFLAGFDQIPIDSMSSTTASVTLPCVVSNGSPDLPPGPLGKLENDSLLLYRMNLTFNASRDDAYVVFDSLDATGLLNARHILLNQIWTDSVDLSGHAVLDSFAQAHLGDAHFDAVLRDWHLIQKESDTSYSGTFSYVAPRNLYFQRLKQLSDILEANADSSMTYALSGDQVDSLAAWADLCPEFYGPVVHRSRALLRLLNPDYVEPVSFCAVSGTGMKRIPDAVNNSSKLSSGRVLLYPNPTDGKTYLNYRAGHSNAVDYTVYNALGIEVYSGTLEPNTEEELPTEAWPSGVYWLRPHNSSIATMRFICR